MAGFSQQIKQARQRLGYSQTSLAKKAGLSLTYLRLIEDGERVPSEDFVLRLAEALGLNRVSLVLAALAEKAPDPRSRGIYETMVYFLENTSSGPARAHRRSGELDREFQEVMDEAVRTQAGIPDAEVLADLLRPGFAAGFEKAGSREDFSFLLDQDYQGAFPPGRIGDGFEFIPKATPHVNAGGGFLVEDESTDGWFSFRRDWLTGHGGPRGKVLLEVEGESMLPTLHNGDVILVDKSEGGRAFRPGRVFVVRDGDGIVVKRLHRGETPHGLRLSSDNPDKSRFPDREILVPEGEASPILGRVIWAGCEIR
ncbi:MAG: S24 family peptidase [Pseudomonadota bacterium]